MLSGYKIIALCISRAGDERHLEFIKALNQAVIRCGFRLFIYHTCSDLYWKTKLEDGDQSVFQLMDYDVLDAVIIFDEAFQEKTAINRAVEAALSHHIPVISIGAKRQGCTSFMFNYERGFEQVLRHVVEYHGATDTCFIAGLRGERDSEQRINVYKRVLADNHIAFRPDRLFYGDYWWGPTQDAVKKIVESGHIPQAIICANDSMAVTVCRELVKYGFSIPEDVYVTGFDGTDSAINYNPPITTCKCDLSLAADNILNVIEDIFQGHVCDSSYDIDYSIAVYRSCGCKNEAPSINVGERLQVTQDRFYKYQDDERTLHEISERIIAAESLLSFSSLTKDFDFDNACILLNRDCFDSSVNPTHSTRQALFDEVMQVLSMSFPEASAYPLTLPRRDILPHMTELLARENPFIFSALSFLGIPMGYVCFCYEMDADYYCRILQRVTFLNNAIGNHRLMSYLRFTAESVEKMSERDFMTGLLNRKGFYNALPLIKEHAAEQDYIAVATVDLDRLKYINDQFGHEDGDFAIISVSDAAKQLPFNTKICGRFGGDELVVCAATSDIHAPQVLKDYIEEYLNNINRHSGKSFAVSASIGVSMGRAEAFDFEQALKESDQRMYEIKQKKPNHRKD